MVELRIVLDLDEIIRLVRLPGWQDTLASEGSTEGIAQIQAAC